MDEVDLLMIFVVGLFLFTLGVVSVIALIGGL